MRRSTTTGSCLFSNSTKKMPQGWPWYERAQLVDALDLGGVLVLQAQLGRRVLEGQVIEAVSSIGQSSSSRR